jgi:hypothetical protein
LRSAARLSRQEDAMSNASALALVQPLLQLCLFAAMVAHMAWQFGAIDLAPRPIDQRDDIPLWPYAS